MTERNDRRANDGARLRSLSLGELLSADLPVRDYILDPLMKQGESMMLWAAPGVGKTMVGLSIALAAAGGGKFLGWKAPRPFRVLYIDGEMALQDLKDRLVALKDAVEGLDADAAAKNLRLLVRSHQDPNAPFPDIADEEGQDVVFSRARCMKADLVILDNFSVLAGVDDENDAAAMQPVLTFLLRMKQAGIATILVHHSNKGGESYRGSSKIATTFEVIVGLKQNHGVASRHTAAFDLAFTKFRGVRNDTIVETTAWLEENTKGVLRWRWKESEDAELARVVTLVRSCQYARDADIAKAMEVSTGKMSKLKNMAIAKKLITASDWQRCVEAARASEAGIDAFDPIDDTDEADSEF
ncbi:AAA family ATPase [Blastochloris tepida]|uniref:AAA+ ATPase domain-containing protein n=1 Tax=Blastochloris tepida TaxID=2233851 RepID=A0A348G4K0_9HYPH|nr:AAA family ATPase [Blastochloris tepida]BBF94483.1 hypothetical protein BLTE_31680 [Blastochloris tepida]